MTAELLSNREREKEEIVEREKSERHKRSFISNKIIKTINCFYFSKRGRFLDFF